MNKWGTFVNERLEPVSHLTMVAVFIVGHILLAKSVGFVTLKAWQFPFLFIGVVFFFTKLRFYDEIKDYETDIIFNPTRPLPRGLVTHQDLYKGIILSIIIETIAFSLCSTAGILCAALAIGYSLLMYKEFFIGKYIRPHLTTYAMSHTVVTILLSLAIFASLSGVMFYKLHKDLILFSIISWLLFNIFEFGRKSYLENEERDHVPTYSNLFTRWGAFALVLSQALIATYLLLKMAAWTQNFRLAFVVILILLIIIGMLYSKAALNTNWGKIYRNFTSIYIVLIYGTVIAHFLI